MSKLFGCFNEADYHNKLMQSNLSLENYWVTQCGCLWLCAKVAMVMTITNLWNIFRCGVKRYHYDKFIGIREFLEQPAIDCVTNTFSTNTRTLENNIPLLDKVHDEEVASTCHKIHFSSSGVCYTEVSTISELTFNTASSLESSFVDSTIGSFLSVF